MSSSSSLCFNYVRGKFSKIKYFHVKKLLGFSSLRCVWFGEVRLHSEIKLLSDYDQNSVKDEMFEILH